MAHALDQSTAELLIREITYELKRGTEHFNKAGEKLTTVKAVLATFLSEGGVELKEGRVDL